MIELNKIYNKDCLEGIKLIPDNSIDALIMDPPYFSGGQHNGLTTEFVDANTSAPFFKELYKEIARITKPTGNYYIFCNWRTFPFFYPLAIQYLNIKNCLVWDKMHGRVQPYYWNTHEFIMFGGQNLKKMDISMKSIIQIKGYSSRGNERKVHPTQKPVELIEKLMLDSTKEGDTVLDCFMGSGTTAVAALRNNRNFIGFEIQEKYFDIANYRIEEEGERMKYGSFKKSTPQLQSN